MKHSASTLEALSVEEALSLASISELSFGLIGWMFESGSAHRVFGWAGDKMAEVVMVRQHSVMREAPAGYMLGLCGLGLLIKNKSE